MLAIEEDCVAVRGNNVRKVGRPITSQRTLARNFPPIEEIRAKLVTGECYTRSRTGGSSSNVWTLFEEAAYTDTQEFTGIVRCRSCNFMTRYHGQITGTSHMRRHHCFITAYPDAFSQPREKKSSMIMSAKVKKETKYTTKALSRNQFYGALSSTPAIEWKTNGEELQISKTAIINKTVNVKTEFREKVIQFCCQELVNLESMTSDSFKVLAHSLMKLGAQVGKCTVALPDINQLHTQMNGLYNQMKHRIKEDLTIALTRNIGGALVCDSENDLCVISAYYINSNWNLIESILSATSQGNDINGFITNTLDDYGLHDDNKLAKFTFVSRGGLFDGVSMCLTSMAHVIDGVIESAVFGDDTYTEVVENCKIICNELKLDIDHYPIDWVNKFEVLRNVVDNRHKFELKNSSLDLDLVKFLVDFLAPFKAASVELRHCSKHPTLNHVLLWYYKLLKALNTSSDDDSLASSLKNMVKVGMEQNFQLQSFHKIAAFLWPNFRFLKMLTNEEREQVHNEVRNLIESRIAEDDDGVAAKKARSDFDEWEDLTDSSQDEVNKYISVQLTTCNEQNILTWWKEHANDFPKLSHLAKWILSIPASVTSLERFKLTSNQDISEELLFMHCNLPFKRTLVMDKSVKTSWKKKMQLKDEINAAKDLEKQVKAAKQQKLEEKRNRREENRRRREENTRKAEIVQSVKNPKKLKRLSKKQMKKIKKM